MASIVLSSVGSSIGSMVLPGVGGRVLGALGGRFGRVLDQRLGLAESAGEGARLESFAVQDSKYGLAIPLVFGRARVAGNVIWASALIETAHKEGGIGKGGIGGGASVSGTRYTYSVHCAVALAQGEIGGVRTIWADSKVIYQDGVWKEGVVGGANVHCGADGQEVDPFLESWNGVGNTPAYRGIAYVVFEGLQLGDFGNRLPNLSFEIVPKNQTGEPQWSGSYAPNLCVSGYANRHGGALPIVIERGGVSARTVLVCGYTLEGSFAKMVACETGVEEAAPTLFTQTQSAAFGAQDVVGHHWALSPGGRFIAFGAQDAGSGNVFHVALYDVQAKTFGSIASFPMENAEYRQIAWLDPQRFTFSQTQGTSRGVRVLMRAGLEIVDLGFWDVWASGSSSTRKVLHYAQFVPCADGLLHIVADASPNFTALYARHISFALGALVMEEPYVLSSGIALGTGSNASNFLLATGQDEWTFAHTSVLDVSLLSFSPGKTSSSIVRGWKKLSTTGTLGVAACQAPAVMGDRIVLAQKSGYENLYRISEISLNEGDFSLVKDAVPLQGFGEPVQDFSLCALGADRAMLLGSSLFGAWAHWGIARTRNTGDTLENVVGALLGQAGYGAQEIDVDSLAGIPLDGYVVSSRVRAADALAPLQVFEPFDLVESDGKMRAVRRGGAPITVDVAQAGALREKDAARAARDEGGTPLLRITRAQELDLPVELTVDTLDAARDYEVGSQRARRLMARGGLRTEKLSLPIVCAPSQAKRIAERALYGLWAERVRYELSLSRQGAVLEPGDVLAFDGRTIRVTETSWKDGVLKVFGVDAGGDGAQSVALAESGGGCAEPGLALAASFLFPLDLPLLRNQDNASGIYVAVGAEGAWPGATLWRASDGVTFAHVDTFSRAAVAGSAVTVLQDGAPFYKDEAASVRVQVYSGVLSGCTEEQLLGGANAAVLGGEIVQFQAAVLVGPGLYELSGLLRGRLGTEGSCGAHQIGEAFVLIEPEAVRFLPVSFSERGQTVSFRAVSFGGSLGKAQNLFVSFSFAGLQPRSVAHVNAARAQGVGSDLVLSWVRRARMNAAWVDYVDVPLDEAAELYDVEVMAGANVVRTFENVGQTSVVYTALQQATDWPGGIPETFTVNVYQKGTLYGRGQKTCAVV